MPARQISKCGPGFLDRGSNFHREGGDLLTLPDSFF